MKKNTIEIIVTSVLVVVLFLVVSKSFAPLWKKKSRAREKKASIIRRAKKTLVDETRPLLERQEERIKSLGWGRDPFFLGRIEESEGDLILHGIIWDEKTPSAIINDTVVEVGDQIGGIKIVEITRSSVKIDESGTISLLHIWQDK